MRLTKHRKQILDLFYEEDGILLNADIILQKLYAKPADYHVNLSTIYRTLDVFLKEGLICKSTVENIAYYYIVGVEHYHYMICLGCHEHYEIKCQLTDMVNLKDTPANFYPTHHDLTIYGYCEKCHKKGIDQ